MIKTMKAVKNRFRRQILLSMKKRNSKHSTRPAAFGSVENLINASQLSPKKLKTFLRFNHHIKSMDCFVKHILG